MDVLETSLRNINFSNSGSFDAHFLKCCAKQNVQKTPNLLQISCLRKTSLIRTTDARVKACRRTRNNNTSILDNNFGECEPIFKLFHQMVRKEILCDKS